MQGLVVGSKYGEYSALSTGESKKLVEIAVDQANGRVLVGVGVIGMDMGPAVELAKHVERLGGDYVMVSQP